jgi:hypothetical protein
MSGDLENVVFFLSLKITWILRAAVHVCMYDFLDSDSLTETATMQSSPFETIAS